MDWDYLASWLPVVRTCGVFILWTFIVAGAAIGIEAVISRLWKRHRA